MRLRNGMRVWTNPEMSKAGSDRDERGILPVYRHSAGLTDVNLRKWISVALEAVESDEDWLGREIIDQRKLCGMRFAYNNRGKSASARVCYLDI